LATPQKLGTDGMIDKRGNNKLNGNFGIFFKFLQCSSLERYYLTGQNLNIEKR